MANPLPEVISTEDPELATAMEHPAGEHGGGHAEPEAFGLGPGAFVGIAMLAFLLILVWKGVHKAIVGGLDSKIAAIREQLEEASALRKEAEALRDEFAAKIATAERDAAAMIEQAQHEADAIVTQAEADAKALVTRRQKMAEEKIAAAELAAVEGLRAQAAAAATAAARELLGKEVDAAADKKLVDKAIAGI